MTTISSFEIVAETLVPSQFNVSPNPFLIQGFFLQLTFASSTPGQTFGFDIDFNETSGFQQGGAGAQKALLPQVIDGAGSVTIYDSATFFTGTPGFHAQSIAAGQTMIFGVQVIPALAAQLIANGAQDNSIQQDGIGWRGTVSITPTGGSSAFPQDPIITTPTQRLVHYDSTAMKTVIDATVYPVPTAYAGATLPTG